ncbi:MAG: DUF5060 domain-containing protein, partial [Verrucomicrobiota bacterium]
MYRNRIGVVLGLSLVAQVVSALDRPLVPSNVLFEEVNGLVAVEAEFFAEQTNTETRRWYRTSAKETPDAGRDPDPPHVAGAGHSAYLEILPDTRKDHGEQLIVGENFSNEPGRLALLHYPVYFNSPGRYYVWVRAHSTGSEDNGIHVGIDGTWPESGRRMQWCQGKETWRWESKQRTREQHCGVPHGIYLDVEKKGRHTISFSMREDGFEFDRWLMTTDRNFSRPEGIGPKVRIREGTLPPPFPVVKTAAGPGDPSTRQPHGDGAVTIGGELRTWHNVTLTMDGPYAHELDKAVNPFTDYRMTVTFRHESGLNYTVPGYFAADGNAAETGADSGRQWRAHLSPDKPGVWTWSVAFVQGESVANMMMKGKPLPPYHGREGQFTVEKTDKQKPDMRARGRLQVVGGRYLRFAESGKFFLKCGADAPENLLAYRDFDGPFATDGHKDHFVKTWEPHIRDWREGDPTWRKGKGKGLIGAINYLASEGMNVFSFLPLNIGGDDRNVFPYTHYDERFRMDVSRLDQWQIVLAHGTRMGMFLHF